MRNLGQQIPQKDRKIYSSRRSNLVGATKHCIKLTDFLLAKSSLQQQVTDIINEEMLKLFASETATQAKVISNILLAGVQLDTEMYVLIAY